MGRRSLGAVIVVGCLLLVAGRQDAATPPPPPTPEEIQTRLAGLEANQRLTDELREQISELLNETLALLIQADAARDRAVELQRVAVASPELLESIRAELTQPAEEPRPAYPPEATLVQLEQMADADDAALAVARSKVNDLQTELTTRRERDNAIPDLLAQTRTRLSELEESIAEAPPTEVQADLADAKSIVIRARWAAAAREIEALEAEQASIEARRDLLPARIDQAMRQSAQAEQLVQAWQAVVSDRRELDARQSAREAQQLQEEAARQHPRLDEFAAEITALADARIGPESNARQIGSTDRQTRVAEKALVDLSRQYDAVQRRLRASGLNRATGLLLRRQYDGLPEISVLRREKRRVDGALDDTEFALIEFEDRRRDAGDIDGIVHGLVETIEPTNVVAFTRSARELAVKRRDLLDDIINETVNANAALEKLSEANARLLEGTVAYTAFIEERILWVQSIADPVLPRGGDFGGGARWLVDPVAWTRIIRLVSIHLWGMWLVSAVGLLAAITLLLARWWALRQISLLGDRVSSYKTDAHRYTVYGFLLTVLAAIAAPAILWVLGWMLTRYVEGISVAAAAGMGTRAAARILLPMSLLVITLRKNGLADMHFRWPEKAQVALRRNLRWLVPVVVPLSFMVSTFNHAPDEAYAGSWGRVFFTIGLIAASIFVYRILKPDGPVLSAFMERHRSGWVRRLRRLWYPMVIGLPLLCAAAAWMGYFYTAVQIEHRFERTWGLVLLVVILNGVLMRWLFIARRQLAVEEARRRRQQAIAETEETEEGRATPETPAVDVASLDLPAISAQTQQLIRSAVVVSIVVGLFVIWNDVLPALRMLHRVEIWPAVRVVDSRDIDVIPVLEHVIAPEVVVDPVTNVDSETEGPPPDAESDEPTTTSISPVRVPESVSAEPKDPAPASPTSTEKTITAADLGIALILLIVTIAAFRNLPGLVEIVILQRLPLDAGSRYALSTVLRYTIAIIGVMASFQALGVTWSKLQWLAAALTFGLAFGLQEIFANFVSGLIILAERPVRVGDTVTVGDVSGTVSRIRMRATTVTDWDRKELIIPNKSFITGHVINWSLSDTTLRLKIVVGIGYGENVRRAESILLQIAAEEEHVLQQPRPTVYFKDFGDSTLDIELRVFIPDIDHWVSVGHDLRSAILERFREAGIEIAFPQRDLHVRSISEELRGAIEPQRDA